jgi:2-iminobutanoate/2-iminopropanoate deaminase
MTTSPPMQRIELQVPGLPPALSHYADVVVHNGTAYISGCLGLDGAGKLIGARDAVAQTRQALTNLGQALRACGSTFADVLKVTVYLLDIDDRSRINPIRQEFFGDALPASTLVQVCALAVPGAAVEIEAIAAVPVSRGA